MLSDDSELPGVILHMIDTYRSFEPREWAMANTGYRNASRKLNKFLKSVAKQKGENWTVDIFQKNNSPHARYSNYQEQELADAAVQHLIRFIRE